MTLWNSEVSRTNIITVLALRTADVILLRTYLIVSQRELPWKANRPTRAGCYSRTASSKHENCSFQCAERRASMGEHGPPDMLQCKRITQEEKIRGIQGHHPVVHERNKKSQRSAGIGASEGCEGQEGLLELQWQSKEG